MVPETQSRRYAFYNGLAVFCIVPGFFGFVFLDRATTVGSGLAGLFLLTPIWLGAIVFGLDHFHNRTEWAEFYADVDWNRRFGRPPLIPMSPQTQPLFHAVISTTIGIAVFGGALLVVLSV